MVGVVLGRQRRFTWWWWWCLVIIFVRLRVSLGLNMCTCIFTYCPYLNHRGKILVAPSHNTQTPNTHTSCQDGICMGGLVV